jgi:hypothetical protein
VARSLVRSVFQISLSAQNDPSASWLPGRQFETRVRLQFLIDIFGLSRGKPKAATFKGCKAEWSHMRLALNAGGKVPGGYA